MIDLDFDLIDKILLISDETLKGKKKRLGEEYKKAMKNIDPEFEGQVEDYFIEEAQEYEQLPNILWTSLFLSCYSLFEAKMIELCEIHQKNSKNAIILKDLNGKGVVKAKLYLTKIANIPERKFHNWEEISIYNKIRNCIIHNNNTIKETNIESLQQYEKKHQSINIDSKHTLKLSIEFCQHAIEVLKKILKDLHGSL